jgi:hypothetical protein
MKDSKVDRYDVQDLDLYFKTRKQSFGVSNKLTEQTFVLLSDDTICVDFEMPVPVEASYDRDSKNRE